MKNDQEIAAGRPGQCKLVLGADYLAETTSEPPFVFGALSDVRNPDDLEASLATKNYRLAIEEFESQGGVSVGGQGRKPVAVVCNVLSESPDSLDRSIDHLTNKLGVNLILATLYDANELKRTFQRVLDRGQGVFFLSPFASDPLLDFSDQGLLWQMLGSPRDVAAAYPPLISLVERYVTSAVGGGLSAPLRLALLDTNDSTDSEIAHSVDTHLVLNGKTATENGRTNFRRFRVVPQTEDSGISCDAVLAELMAFRPHIIVPVTDPSFFPCIMSPLERDWSRIAPGQPKPFYVLAPRHVRNVFSELAEHPDARTRIVGVNIAAARDRAPYERYLRRLEALYPNHPNLGDTENYYDAAYFALYAASAGSLDGEVTGRDVATGMQQLLRGPTVEVGPNAIPEARRYLVEDRLPISLHGTLGPPDEFDADTGMRRGEGSVWCIDETPDGFQYRMDTLRLAREGGGFEGDFACFPGFGP